MRQAGFGIQGDPRRQAARAATVALALLAFTHAAAGTGIDNPAGPLPATLYFHLAGFQDFPVNTQEPDANFTTMSQGGLTALSATCVPAVPGATGQSYHTLFGYSSPGYVEYGVLDAGVPRVHQERGLSWDVQFADPMVVHWYLSTTTGLSPGAADPDTFPVPAPRVIVSAALVAPVDDGLGAAGVAAGETVASGRSAEVTLAGPLTTAVGGNANYSTVDGHPVYDITVPLSLAQATVPKAHGFLLRVDTFLDVPACGDPAGAGYVMPDTVKVHSSPGHRPRLEVNVREPVRVEYLHPQFVGGQLLVHTAANSVWGNYDVDEATGYTLTATGPGPITSLREGSLVQRTHEHGTHTEQASKPWVWDYAADGAAAGTYTFTLTVWNDQHTAKAIAVATVDLGGDAHTVTKCGDLAGGNATCTAETQSDDGGPAGSVGSPGAGLAGLFAVGLGAAARRRGAR